MTSRENVTSIPHAVHLTLQGLTQEEIQHVARECGYAVPTVYQWGEFNDSGEPRMRIPAAVVPAFCRATNDPLVWETLQRLMRRDAPAIKSKLSTPLEVYDDLAEITALAHNALEDNVIDSREQAAILAAFAKTAAAVLHCHGHHVTNTRPFKRASTLAEAEGKE